MSDVFEDAGGVEGGADDPAEAPGVAEPETTVLVESAAPPWAPSQDDWQALTGTVQALAQQFQPAPEVPEPPSFQVADETTGETYIDPAGLQAYIDFQIQQGIQGTVGPYKPILDQTTADRGEQLISQHLDQLQTTVGDFDTELARQIAEGLAARQGADPFQALKQGAEIAHAKHHAIGQAAVEEYKKTLGNIGSAPREPGAAGAGVERLEPRPGLQGYNDVADNFVARLQAA